MDPHESEEEDEKGGENKKVKKEDEQSGLRILKTEPVDGDGIVQLDDDELSASGP